MYFKDLTPYTYTQARAQGDAWTRVNFGWLDADHDYAESELAYKAAHGADALLSLWEKERVPFWDPGRSPVPHAGSDGPR